MLGVTATTIGIVSGFGELMGYAARFFSGYLGDRTGRYWAVTIAGYVLNLFAVPLLALAGAWEIAVVLIVRSAWVVVSARLCAMRCCHTLRAKPASAGVSACTKRSISLVASSGRSS